MGNKKALYVSFALGLKNTGGFNLAKSNMEYVKTHHKGSVDIVCFSFNSDKIDEEFLLLDGYRSKIDTFINSLQGYMGGMSSKNNQKILKLIGENKYEYVYFDSSLFGNTIQKIKKKFKDVNIVTFFHNVERDFFKARVKAEGVYYLPIYFSAAVNEKKSCIYSDVIFTLTKSDSSKISHYYNRIPSCIIPLTVKDRLEVELINRSLVTNNKLFFVGGNFFGNREGIVWFIQKILPHIDFELHIVGKGWNQVPEIKNNPKVKLLGYVDSLNSTYREYPIVIAPIISGGGMKTKISEAFMYGKFVIGTKFAFEGFDGINNSFTQICTNDVDFISYLEQIRNREICYFTNESREFYDSFLAPNRCMEKFESTLTQYSNKI